ncbi:Peptide hydrolase [Mycena venus]|uniref:Peptide hydrolase n=1 Tax=Mycena venus TaxID=2733690 RepID=A0A8H7DE75_9AGAR|nr:Peptide hydrolase [Mycena venus]
MMKYLLALVAVSCVAVAVPAGGEQAMFDVDYKHPGFDWDLSAQRLVQMEGQAPIWMSELEKIQAKAQGIKFFDITDTQDLGTVPRLQVKASEFPPPNATEKVKTILKKLSTEGPRKNLEHFSSFKTRHYRSDTGKQSQRWLKTRITEASFPTGFPTSLISPYPDNVRMGVKIPSKPHLYFRILPQLGSELHSSRFLYCSGEKLTLRVDYQNQRVVHHRRQRCHYWGSSGQHVNPTPLNDLPVSTHVPVRNMWPFLPAPGADDDGSGTVTILETYRALLAGDFHPERSIEFHWYSAEFDMTAWVKVRGTREEVGIMTDFVDLSLAEFNKQLVDAYLDIPWVETKCGYGCSDHASWTKAGFPSSCGTEGAFENTNNHIHSANDRIDFSDEFSFEHMVELAKLSVAFAVELGGVSN